MEPILIHYCNFNNLKEKHVAYQESTEYLKQVHNNPKYKIVEHTENDDFIKDILQTHNACKEIFEIYKQRDNKFNWTGIHEYIKLCILYEYGGFYVEMDMVTHRPLDELYDISINNVFIKNGKMINSSWLPIYIKKHDKTIGSIIELINTPGYIKTHCSANDKETVEFLQFNVDFNYFKGFNLDYVSNYVSHFCSILNTTDDYLKIWYFEKDKIKLSTNIHQDNIQPTFDENNRNTTFNVGYRIDNLQGFAKEIDLLNYIRYRDIVYRNQNKSYKTEIIVCNSVKNYINSFSSILSKTPETPQEKYEQLSIQKFIEFYKNDFHNFKFDINLNKVQRNNQPKLIHYINFNNEKSKNILYQESIDYIKKLNEPLGYKIIEHTENDDYIKFLLENMPAYKEILNNNNPWQIKEYIKLHILYKYGGFYISMGTFSHKPLETIYGTSKNLFVMRDNKIINESYMPLYALQYNDDLADFLLLLNQTDYIKNNCFSNEYKLIYELSFENTTNIVNLYEAPLIKEISNLAGYITDISNDSFIRWDKSFKNIIISSNINDNIDTSISDTIYLTTYYISDIEPINVERFSKEIDILNFIRYAEYPNNKNKLKIKIEKSMENYIISMLNKKEVDDFEQISFQKFKDFYQGDFHGFKF